MGFNFSKITTTGSVGFLGQNWTVNIPGYSPGRTKHAVYTKTSKIITLTEKREKKVNKREISTRASKIHED